MAKDRFGRIWKESISRGLKEVPNLNPLAQTEVFKKHFARIEAVLTEIHIEHPKNTHQKLSSLSNLLGE